MDRVIGLLTGEGAEGADRKFPSGCATANWPGTAEKRSLRHHTYIGLRKSETAMLLPAWEIMNDQQLDRNLRSVGREIFVAYFAEFCDRSRSNEDVAIQIEEERGYTEKSCRPAPVMPAASLGQGGPRTPWPWSAVR